MTAWESSSYSGSYGRANGSCNEVGSQDLQLYTSTGLVLSFGWSWSFGNLARLKQAAVMWGRSVNTRRASRANCDFRHWDFIVYMAVHGHKANSHATWKFFHVISLMQQPQATVLKYILVPYNYAVTKPSMSIGTHTHTPSDFHHEETCSISEKETGSQSWQWHSGEAHWKQITWPSPPTNPMLVLVHVCDIYTLSLIFKGCSLNLDVKRFVFRTTDTSKLVSSESLASSLSGWLPERNRWMSMLTVLNIEWYQFFIDWTNSNGIGFLEKTVVD